MDMTEVAWHYTLSSCSFHYLPFDEKLPPYLKYFIQNYIVIIKQNKYVKKIIIFLPDHKIFLLDLDTQSMSLILNKAQLLKILDTYNIHSNLYSASILSNLNIHK